MSYEETRELKKHISSLKKKGYEDTRAGRRSERAGGRASPAGCAVRPSAVPDTFIIYLGVPVNSRPFLYGAGGTRFRGRRGSISRSAGIIVQDAQVVVGGDVPSLS
jgi:hypothetical protein